METMLMMSGMSKQMKIIWKISQQMKMMLTTRISKEMKILWRISKQVKIKLRKIILPDLPDIENAKFSSS